ncbi:MAG: hypothetical protein EPO36_09060 [Chloroflexota bacterium]|nr:MAG: hypothetical protein EPO36_09060 [Chloroflexota bacterium]
MTAPAGPNHAADVAGELTSVADAATGPRARFRRRLAGVLAIAGVVQTILTFGLARFGDPRFRLPVDLVTIGALGILLLFPIMGALIIQRRPFTRVPWLMIAVGLGIGLGLSTTAYGVNGLPPAGPLPFAVEALVISQVFFVPSLAGATVLILLLFPTDRLVGPRWRYVAWLAFAASAIDVVGALSRPDLNPEMLPGVPNPIAPAGSAGLVDILFVAANLTASATLILAAASLVVRYRGAGSVERAQIRWLALFGVLAAVAFSVTIASTGPLGDTAFGIGILCIACMPIGIGIAITRYRLYDIDRLINRAIVYAFLTAILAGIFAAAAGLSQRLFVAFTGETSDAAIVATTLVVAALYTPLRTWLDAVVDRRFKYERARFGSYRDELQKALSLVDATAAAERLAKEIARETTIADVAVLDEGGAPSATLGQWPIAEAQRIAIPGGHGALSAVAIGGGADRSRRTEAWQTEIEEIASLAARTVRRRDGR